MNPDCYFGDHDWRGSSQCVHCGARLRCNCGVYVREDNLNHHFRTCPAITAELADERAKIEATFL